MISSAAARYAVVALALCALLGCRGQLRLEDDGGSVNEDAGPDSPRVQNDGSPAHVGCVTDGDCGIGRVCVQATRRCATTCVQLTDCVSGGFFCDVTRSICVRCTGDSVCKNLDPDQPFCEADGLCAQCLDDSVCPATKPRCDRTRGTCAECLGTADCSGAKRFCDPGTSTCVSP